MGATSTAAPRVSEPVGWISEAHPPFSREFSLQADAAHEAALRNLLQRRGYVDLDAVLEEGREAGREEGELAMVMRLLERRVGSIAAADRQRIRALNRDQLTSLAEASAGFSEQLELNIWLTDQG